MLNVLCLCPWLQITTLIDGFISPTENLYDRGVNMRRCIKRSSPNPRAPPPPPPPHPCPPPPDPRRYLVTEVHEMSLRELLINRPALDLEDIRLMACHLLRGLNVRGTCGGVFHASG